MTEAAIVKTIYDINIILLSQTLFLYVNYFALTHKHIMIFLPFDLSLMTVAQRQLHTLN